MSTTETTPEPTPSAGGGHPPGGDPAGASGSGRGILVSDVLAVGLLLLAVLQPVVSPRIAAPRLETWATIFVSLVVQATPFLVLGVLLSGAIAVLVPASWLAKALPHNRVGAVCVAGAAGVVVPGCECGSVPISGRLMSRGVAPAAALTFMLAAPAVNPVVLASTAVAFPGQPEVVLARFLASLATAIGIGLLWERVGRGGVVRNVFDTLVEHGDRLQRFTATLGHDFLHAGGYLVVGAAAAATIQVVVPQTIIDTLAGSLLVSVVVMATLAVVLSICSEADAFVAASMSAFPLRARLVFLVVGPAVDLKLIAMQVGVFGRRFAARFVPLSLAVSITAALVAGAVLR
ncbi:MAG: permease [Actinomycetes bacterium]